MDEATEKQMAVIRRLAKQTSTDIDLSKIGSKKEASKLIDELIGKRKGKSTNGGNEHRDKKCVYGLAVKLVFRRYMQLGTNYRTEAFWKEVDEFYQQYLKHQDRATKLDSQR